MQSVDGKKKALMPTNAKTWTTSALHNVRLDVKQRNIAQHCATSAPTNYSLRNSLISPIIAPWLAHRYALFLKKKLVWQLTTSWHTEI